MDRFDGLAREMKTGGRNAAPWASAIVVAALAAAAMVAAIPVSAAGNSVSFKQGLLWRIAKPGIADSYVFGTIHVADPRVAAIPKNIEAAFARSRTLAMEIPPVAVVDAQAFSLEELDDGGRLEPLIGPPAFAQLSAELRAQGIADGVIERLKPWAAMMKLDLGGSRGDTRSLDENLLVAARVRRMQLVSLESIDEQIAAFDSIPVDSQVALLRHALAHRESMASYTDPAIAAWLRGDLAGLAHISNDIGARFPDMKPHYAQLTRHIIDDRTVVMHHRLFMPLRGGNVFVAVGALHLYGDAGLLALLRKDGYRVTRIW